MAKAIKFPIDKNTTIHVQTPEGDRVLSVKEKSQAIGEFLEWLQSDGVVLAHWPDESDELIPIFDPIERLLARYFDIDLAKVEEEKLALLRAMRAQHEGQLTSDLVVPQGYRRDQCN